MKAPDKLYYTTLEDSRQYYTSGIPFEREYVEYARTDAFIEKAVEWVKYNNENGGCQFDNWEEDFRKYMKE